MKKTIATLLLTSAFAAPLLFAQSSGNPPSPANRVERRVQFLTTLLTLTTAQQQQATTIFTNEATSATTLLASLRTARQSLRTAVENTDANTINQLSTTIGNLTAQLASNEATANAAFYQMLTPDQQAKLKDYQSRGPRGGGRGRGGFRGGR